jgi:hypothetical protein
VKLVLHRFPFLPPRTEASSRKHTVRGATSQEAVCSLSVGNLIGLRWMQIALSEKERELLACPSICRPEWRIALSRAERRPSNDHLEANRKTEVIRNLQTAYDGIWVGISTDGLILSCEWHLLSELSSSSIIIIIINHDVKNDVFNRRVEGPKTAILAFLQPHAILSGSWRAHVSSI